MNKNKVLYWLPFGAILAVCMLGMLVDVMDVDASQYATMSWEMLHTKGFLQITDRYQPYLDKPPLLFWLCSLSYKLFGVSNFTYKIPSLVFAIIAVFSTYKLSNLFYNAHASYLAVLILASSQAVFLITNDCRTDTLLMGSVAMATYHLVKYLQQQRSTNLIWGFVGVSLAMLSKGPIGLMVPVLAIGADAIIKRKWGNIFKPQWIIGLLIVAVMLSPMCWGLYQQWGKEGLGFFFWTQSFGRITGESIWKDDTTALFFTHTMLWAFLPWSLIFILAVFDRIKAAVQSKFERQEEYISLAGFILPFIALSASKYKLPHYIFVILPFAAILTARYLYIIYSENKPIINTIRKMQAILLSLLWVVASLLTLWAFREGYYLCFYMIGSALAALAIVKLFQQEHYSNTVIASVCMILAVNILLAGHIYPQILKHQTTGDAGRIISQEKQAGDEIISLQTKTNHSFDFYCQMIVPNYATISQLQSDEMLKGKQVWIYTTQNALDSLSSAGVKLTKVYGGDHFNVSKLNLFFINPETRLAQTRKRYVIKASL